VMAIDPLTATETGGGGLTGGVSSQDEPTVTLIVTPEQAEKLVFAQEMGTVWFALIPSGDTQEVTTPGRAVINIFPR
jgi:Flp pilus assembly protein CpaB